MRMKMARYTPVRLAYKVFEASWGTQRSRPPVIFLHGMLCSKEIWDDIPLRVAEALGNKVYTYDARNHGRSEFIRDYSFDQNVRDLFEFMNKRKIKDPVLIGHSMGGMTAIAAALSQPHMVKKAIIVDMYVRKIDKELINESITFMKTWVEIVRKLPKETPISHLTKISVSKLYEKLPENVKWKSEMESLLMSRFLYVRTPDGGFDVSFNPTALTEALLRYRDAPVMYTEALRMVSDSPIIRNLTKYNLDGPDLPHGFTYQGITHTGQFDGPSYFIYGSNSPFRVGSEVQHIKKHFPKAQMIQYKGSHYFFNEYKDQFVLTLIDKIYA